jgi:hypothetical protein
MSSQPLAQQGIAIVNLRHHGVRARTRGVIQERLQVTRIEA